MRSRKHSIWPTKAWQFMTWFESPLQPVMWHLLIASILSLNHLCKSTVCLIFAGLRFSLFVLVFFSNQCAFTVVWSPYFCFKISSPQTIAVAHEQFWPHLCKMSHQCHTQQLCQIEAPTDTIKPEFYWHVRRSPNSHKALWPIVMCFGRHLQFTFACSSQLCSSWNLVFSFIRYVVRYTNFSGIFNFAQPFDQAVMCKM